MGVVIEVDEISKLFRLGKVGTGTLSHDLRRWWALMRGQEDPYTKIGSINDRARKGNKDEYVWALQDIDFQVCQGDVVGIIGKNGAGKSTLLKILSRITAPTRGTVKLKGRVASLLEVGTGFHPELTGRENVFMNGTLLGMTRKEIQRKLDEIIDFAGVALYIDTPVKRYSSGMQVRLGFAVAAFLEPEILIVDEVLAVGDAEFQKKAIGRMQEVSSGDGRTILFVSHNLGAVAQLCSKGILLNDGRISAIGDIQSVLNSYVSTSSGREMIIDRREFAEWKNRNQFVSFSMVNKEGKIANEFLYTETISLHVKLFVPELDLHLELAISLYDRIKNRIFTIHEPLSSFKSEGQEIEALIALPAGFLTPGIYSWLMCINKKGVGIQDLHDDFYGFRIIDNGSPFNAYQEGSYGCVFVNYAIEK